MGGLGGGGSVPRKGFPAFPAHLRMRPVSPTRTTSIHQHMTGAAAYVPRHIEKEEKPGMRQFGEALGEPEVPQWPTRQLHWMRGVVRGKEEAGPGIFNQTQWSPERPLPTPQYS